MSKKSSRQSLMSHYKILYFLPSTFDGYHTSPLWYPLFLNKELGQWNVTLSHNDMFCCMTANYFTCPASAFRLTWWPATLHSMLAVYWKSPFAKSTHCQLGDTISTVLPTIYHGVQHCGIPNNFTYHLYMYLFFARHICIDWSEISTFHLLQPVTYKSSLFFSFQFSVLISRNH